MRLKPIHLGTAFMFGASLAHPLAAVVAVMLLMAASLNRVSKSASRAETRRKFYENMLQEHMMHRQPIPAKLATLAGWDHCQRIMVPFASLDDGQLKPLMYEYSVDKDEYVPVS
jgi:hypothetical protein